MKSILRLLFLAAFGISSAALARGDTISITNASFENPALSASGYAENQASSGWTMITISGSSSQFGPGYCANGSIYKNPLAVDGTQVAMLKGSGGIYQSLSGFTAGQTYEISFYAAGRVTTDLTGSRANSIQVCVGNSTATATALTFSVSGSNTTTITPAVAYYTSATGAVGSWTQYTATFTATNTTQVLEFVSNVNADMTTFIDKVSIATVPEPSTTVLSLITGVGLTAFAWRKRRLKLCGSRSPRIQRG